MLDVVSAVRRFIFLYIIYRVIYMIFEIYQVGTYISIRTYISIQELPSIQVLNL